MQLRFCLVSMFPCHAVGYMNPTSTCKPSLIEYHGALPQAVFHFHSRIIKYCKVIIRPLKRISIHKHNKKTYHYEVQRKQC